VAGRDYTAAPVTVTFSTGQTSKAVTLPLIDNSTFEGNRALDFSLSIGSDPLRALEWVRPPSLASRFWRMTGRGHGHVDYGDPLGSGENAADGLVNGDTATSSGATIPGTERAGLRATAPRGGCAGGGG